MIKHKPRRWTIQASVENQINSEQFALYINGIKFEDMPEAPFRERAALARTTITMKMDGPKK